MNDIFLVNPMACRKKLGKVISLIREKEGDDCEIFVSEKAGDIRKKAAELQDRTIYSVGGDGTFLEAVNGTYGKGNTLCALQVGSGNDFVRSIGGEKDYRKIINGIGTYSEKTIDVGTVDGEYFANIASVGYDAEVVRNAERYKKTPFLRNISYILSVFYTLFTYKGINIKADIDGEKFEGNVLLMAFANGQYYGGGIRIAPTASMDDGYLDVYLIDKLSMFKVFTLLPKLTNGSHANLKYVHKYKAKKIAVESDTDMLFNADGDLSERKSITIGIIEGGLRVIDTAEQKKGNL